MQFAMGIALRLYNSAIAFTLHAVFPFIGIKSTLDLEATAGYRRVRNGWIETMKRVRFAIISDPEYRE